MRVLLTKGLSILVVILGLGLYATQSAHAKVHCYIQNNVKVCVGEDSDTRPGGANPEPTSSAEPGGGGEPIGDIPTGSGDRPADDGKSPTEIWEDEVEEITDSNDAAIDKYQDEIGDFIACQDTGTAAACGDVPTAPDLEDVPPRPDDPEGADPGPTTPIFTPPQAAWIVISTELIIPQPKPGMGPAPEDSRWDMAVVGYPYWLWAEGETQASAEASAGGLHVSLDAHVSGLVFGMGDGNKVKCKGAGTKWVESQHTDDQEPAESPTCGYRWEKMSGKGKEYTVTMTAYWEVDWVAGDATGTEYLVTTETRQVPVGELQVVVDG